MDLERERRAIRALNRSHMTSAEHFRPSTDIAAAWQVVERLRERGLTVVISSPPNGYQDWDVRGWNTKTNDDRFIAHADSAPLAICRAALAAVEGE